MENKDIIKGNRIIVEFLNNWTDTGLEPAFFVYKHKGYEINELKFHESWDWLLPVIGKISNQCEEPEELDGLKYALLTDNIEEAYIFVTSYLESYNSLDINKVLNDETD